MTSSVPFSDRPAGDDEPISPDDLEARLDAFLDAAPSRRSAGRVADGLGPLSRQHQELILHWAEVAAQSYTELGYLVASLAPQAMARLDREQLGAWVVGALDQFDRSGGRAAMDYLRDVDGFLLRAQRGDAVAHFDAAEARVLRFVQGLAGRSMRLAESTDSSAWTDTETIFLPRLIADLPAQADNLAQFRLRAAVLWGQARFGTYQVDPAAALDAWPDRTRALAWLALLEAIRIEARIAAELPGLAAEIARARAPWPAPLAGFVAELGAADATIDDSLRLLGQLLQSAAADDLPPVFPHVGRLDPEAARRVREARIETDKATLSRALKALASGPAAETTLPAIEAVADGQSIEIRIDGEAVALPPEARAAIQSLVQDLGEVPPDALVPAGPAPWAPTTSGEGASAELDPSGADYLYDEWDFRRNAYRTHWCHLYEHAVREGDPDFVPRVRQRYAALIRQLRRRFEVLRGEDRVQRRQPDGEDIDLDALVAARADRRAGASVSPNLFARRLRNQRSLAVMFMIDMSGSTQGWINDAEREALVMLGEAVETLGDAWAIYGFSGWTRTRCDLYRVKAFDEAYNEVIHRRIAAIEAKDYTRMGVAIRHLGKLLAAQPARHRLLVTLSDGKPDDFSDEYRSRYGIEDTRHALLEARARGVRSYCVTIDRHGADYLRHMYGPAGYTVLDDVRKLPLRIAEIYRRLAT